MEADMADTMNDSRATYSGGLRGFLIGAVIGAVVASLLGVIFAMLNFGEGGPGMHAMAGAAFGGLVGFMVGILSARRRIPRR
jgi:hypothetical protein